MGLLDILHGMQNGPRGQRQPSSDRTGHGMSPIMMALIALLAYKAFKGRAHHTTAPAASSPSASSAGTASSADAAAHPSGGLGDILGGLFGTRADSVNRGSLSDLMKGGLGGLLGGTAAGSTLSGGLRNLVKELEDRGHGKVVQSWVGTGQNKEIAPSDLEQALGSETIDALAQQTGIDRTQLLAGLSEHLPDLVDQLTPQGRLPTDQEAARLA
jgi:uncharacterized protein YidB (DUF937 family)